MSELGLQNPEFEIQVNISGATQTITVKPEETSDGATYYSCLRQGDQLTQIRLNEEGQWEQLWGNLDQPAIDIIGKAIKAKTII